MAIDQSCKAQFRYGVIGSPASGKMPLSSDAELQCWYQFYFATERGRAFRQDCHPSFSSAAEQSARAANADVGESVAEFFPKIGLTGSLGRISPELSAFTLGSANAWSVAAETTGPLFEGGELVAQYYQAKATREEAVLHYRQTILFAFRDVSDALITRERLAEIRDQQAIEVASLQDSVRLSTERYLAGKASYYEVLESSFPRNSAWCARNAINR